MKASLGKFEHYELPAVLNKVPGFENFKCISQSGFYAVWMSMAGDVHVNIGSLEFRTLFEHSLLTIG